MCVTITNHPQNCGLINRLTANAGWHAHTHTYRIFTAEHKSNLATWISWDGAVGVLHHGEESLAKVAHFLYQLQMEPLAFSCESNKRAERGWEGGGAAAYNNSIIIDELTSWQVKTKKKNTLGTQNSAISQRRLHQLIVGLLEQTFSWACRQTTQTTSPTAHQLRETVNRDLRRHLLPTGSEESVMITSKASWFCFMNSKPSPTWRVSFGLKNPLAIPGRYFLDTLMTSCTADNNENQSSVERGATLRKQPPGTLQNKPRQSRTGPRTPPAGSSPLPSARRRRRRQWSAPAKG